MSLTSPTPLSGPVCVLARPFSSAILGDEALMESSDMMWLPSQWDVCRVLDSKVGQCFAAGLGTR